MENINRGQYWGTQYIKPKDEKHIKTKRQTLFIDNRYRTSGNNVDFTTVFNIQTKSSDNFSSFDVFKNVTSVELKGVHGNFADNSYIVLDIDELNNRVVSNVPVVNQSFCVLYCHNNFRGQQFIKGVDFDRKIKHFNPPLSSLNSLHIKIKQADGTSSTDTFVNDPGVITIIFEIEMIENTIY